MCVELLSYDIELIDIAVLGCKVQHKQLMAQYIKPRLDIVRNRVIPDAPRGDHFVDKPMLIRVQAAFMDFEEP